MKDKYVVNTTAKKVYKRNMLMRASLIIVLFLLLFLSALYFILYIVNTKGNFTVELDPNLKASKNIVMSASSDFKETPLILETHALEYMDNISESWLPLDIDDAFEGEHNGNNYIAYTFFVKNRGKEETSYVSTIDILSVIKNVDDAIRIALYVNGEKNVYAKWSKNGSPEPKTTKFRSKDQVFLNSRSNFLPGEVDKYTIVIWLEGDDPECVDAILGGEMKMKMSLGEDKK